MTRTRPRKRLVDLDDKDAAAQADDIMQFAGREMRKAKALLEDPPKDIAMNAVRDEFMQWMHVDARRAARRGDAVAISTAYVPLDRGRD
jgi:hypothetical protein